jgi:hypothetical protein
MAREGGREGGRELRGERMGEDESVECQERKG